jgi:PKD repeat protein
MGAAVLAVLVVACSTETPTAPVQVPAPVITAMIASFTCSGALPTVQFFDLSTGNPTSWSWNFGDGGTSRSQDPVHTYSDATIDYRVTLTVSKAGATSATTQAFVSFCASVGGGGDDDDGA